jgi:hypothetical protein
MSGVEAAIAIRTEFPNARLILDQASLPGFSGSPVFLADGKVVAILMRDGKPEVHFGLGYQYWKQQRYEDAKREFRAELAQQPQHPQSLLYLGDAEMHLGLCSG